MSVTPVMHEILDWARTWFGRCRHCLYTEQAAKVIELIDRAKLAATTAELFQVLEEVSALHDSFFRFKADGMNYMPDKYWFSILTYLRDAVIDPETYAREIEETKENVPSCMLESFGDFIERMPYDAPGEDCPGAEMLLELNTKRRADIRDAIKARAK